MKKHPTLSRIEKTWKWKIYLKIIGWFLLFLGFTLGLIWLCSVSYLIVFPMLIIVAIVNFMELRKRPEQEDIVKLVNSQFHFSQYSTELVFEEELQGLKYLQKEKVLAALNKTIPHLSFPVNWRPLLLTFISFVILLLVFSFWTGNRMNQVVSNGEESFLDRPLQSDTTYLKDAYVVVTPPTYSLMSPSKSELDLEVLDQSSLEWSITFEGIPNAVWIKMSQGDSLAFRQEGDKWTTRYTPKLSGFYSIVYREEDRVVSSPYHQLRLMPDQMPSALISGIPQYQRLDYQKDLEIEFNVSLSDDFGLTDGYIVATITKGSGESVMFREQKISLPMKVKGKKIIAPMELRPDDFGMEPGNELYFYATAFDNRKPSIQQSRTETYFFVLKDTAQVEFSLEGSLGVDLMPDFFRSQLQIIIDTKKLIEDKSTLKKKEFNFKSNELGFDQKQLRLKYGQFIGEEDESGLDIETEEPEEIGEVDHDGSNVLEEFGHDHDHENEAGQHMDKGTEPVENEKNRNPLQDYMHDHGDEETATFHTQTLKSKLRAALAEMWNAELYLRLFQPEKSLPYQYRAQELLKEIKNHARIYVQRIGFDPPPVNESESRLTGKMKRLNETPFQEEQEKELDYPFIRSSIPILDQVLISQNWKDSHKETIREAGNELSRLAIEQSGEYLDALNVMKILLDKDEIDQTDLIVLNSLKLLFERIILESDPLPAGDQQSMDEMSTHFLKKLIENK